jgi:hypothetical protein
MQIKVGLHFNGETLDNLWWFISHELNRHIERDIIRRLSRDCAQASVIHVRSAIKLEDEHAD